jgi:hypothetical protein
MSLIEASNTYRAQTGSYPTSIQTLVVFCDGNPRLCSLDPQLATGRAGGYIYGITISSEGFEIVAEPEVPGITGSYTLTIGPNVTDRAGNPIVTRMPTPGSDAARRTAFEDIFVSAARAVVELLNMRPNAISQVNAYTGSTTVNAGVLDLLDADNDDDVSIEEINRLRFTNTTFDDQAGLPLRAFIDRVYLDLRWDNLNQQDRESIGVATGDINGDASEALFSYDALRRLTMLFVPDGTSNTMMIRELNNAEAAETSGDDKGKSKALKDYRKLVRDQIGMTLTRSNADILITLSYTL